MTRQVRSRGKVTRETLLRQTSDCANEWNMLERIFFIAIGVQSSLRGADALLLGEMVVYDYCFLRHGRLEDEKCESSSSRVGSWYLLLTLMVPGSRPAFQAPL